MRLKNSKLKFTLPDTKLTIRKPELSLVNVLNWLEIAVLCVAPLFIFLYDVELTKLENWIGIVYALLLIRVIKMLFYGMKAFPSVEFDMRLLFFITAILLMTIVRGDTDKYTSLGGTSILGIGMLMLSGLGMYLWVVGYRSFNMRRFFLYFWHGFMVLFLLDKIFFDENYKIDGKLMVDQVLFYIALVGMLLSLAGLAYFRNKLAKTQMFVGMLAGLVVVVLGMNWENVLYIAGALGISLLAYLLGGSLQDLKSIGSNFKDSIKKFQKGKLGFIDFVLVNFRIIGFLILILLLLGLGVAFKMNDGFNDYFNSYWDFYRNLHESIDNFKFGVIGHGLRGFPVDAATFIISYGAVGVVFGLILLLKIVSGHVGEIGKDIKSGNYFSLRMNILLLWVVSLGIARFFTGFLYLTDYFVFLSTLVLILGLQSKSFDHLQNKVTKLQSVDYIDFGVLASSRLLTKLLSAKVWQELFLSIRVVLVVALIILSPSILQFVIDLF